MKLDNVKRLFRSLLEAAASQREALETLVANSVLIAMIVVLGLSAGARLDRVKNAERQVSAVHAMLKQWPSRYQPPSEPERQMWSIAASDIERLGVRPGQKLLIAQLLGQASENAGVPDARIRFTSASGGAPRVVGSREFKAADYGAIVEFESSFASAVEFIPQLPGAVSITSLSMERAEYGVRAVFALQVFERTEATP